MTQTPTNPQPKDQPDTAEAKIREIARNICYEHFDCDEPECLQRKVNDELAAQRQALRDEVMGAIGEPNELRDYDYKFGPAAFKNQPIRHEKWQKDVLREELRTAISTIFEGKPEDRN